MNLPELHDKLSGLLEDPARDLYAETIFTLTADYLAANAARLQDSPACHAPTGETGNPATPPLEELRILLNAGAYWADGEADEDHPDPMSEVCDIAREANDLFNRIFPETP